MCSYFFTGSHCFLCVFNGFYRVLRVLMGFYVFL